MISRSDMTESAILKDIISLIKLHGGLVMRMNTGFSGRHNIKLMPPGTPDILAILSSGVLWIEVKTEKGKLRPEQVKMHKELRNLGQRVIVARSINDVLKEI